jgi:ABC-type branched-subunit amino acid transport system substrate-binding protein
MSYIRIIEINSAPNTDLLSATLHAAEIDDITGAINPPRKEAQGKLNIQKLVELNQQVINNFQTQTSRYQYFSTNIQLPDNMICGYGDPIDRLRLDIENLRTLLNQTLSQSSWIDIRDALLNSLTDIDRTQTVRLIIRTNDLNLQSLPIEGTSFITSVLNKNGREISVVFDAENGSSVSAWGHYPKILLVFGSQENIELPLTENEVAKYFPAQASVKTLIHPSKDLLLNTISDGAFDVVMIIAHSSQNNNGLDGKIDINEQGDWISINDWTEPFQHSVHRGLKLVVLAGCASVGLARSLASKPIGVPNVVSFRMPVHYRTLRSFLDRLLTKWIKESRSLEIAVSQTRAELTVYNQDFPGASPILLSGAYALPLMFPVQTEIKQDLTSSQSSPPEPFFLDKTLSKIKAFGIKKAKVLLVFLLGFAIAIVWAMQPKLADTCNSIIGDSISCGEEILLEQPAATAEDKKNKQDAALAIANNDYNQAIRLLNSAWESQQDPEVLVMLENAKIAAMADGTLVRSIALNLPISKFTPIEISTNMLKAIGYLQQKWNANSSHNSKLQIVLTDDRNDPVHAANVAKSILDRGIIATIGSYSSMVTSGIKDIYQNSKTVLISGTSTSPKLTNKGTDTFFYRVCSTNRIAGKQMAEYIQKKGYTRVAIFNAKNDTFSESMTEELKANITGLDIVETFDFRSLNSPIDSLKRAKNNGAQVIFLFPSPYTGKESEKNAFFSIIRSNESFQLQLVGNEVVADPNLFSKDIRLNKNQLEKLIISTTWHQSIHPNSKIPNVSFWNDKNSYSLDHRLAMNHDAMLVLIEAIDRLPTNWEFTFEDRKIIDRKNIQKIISNGLTISGITGKIQFQGSDVVNEQNSLITPKCDDQKCDGFKPAI